MSGFIVDIPECPDLSDYESIAHLAPAVDRLRSRGASVVDRLQGRTVWMVSSTAQGGGVAEMLPTMVTLMNELGIDTRWFVIQTDQQPFFHLTKGIHNLIHGAGDPRLVAGDARDVYEAVNTDNATTRLSHMKNGDVLVAHDPQPMGLAGPLRKHLDINTVWRCHIGLDEENEATRAAWRFLEPYADDYERSVFSAEEYIPTFFRDRARLIYPSIDPLSDKNRELHLHSVVGILSNAALSVPPRLQADGLWAPAVLPADIGLLIRPIVTQISRWDRLKGWLPLMQGFVELKERFFTKRAERPAIQRRRLNQVRLVMAGPDPASIQDDPEGLDVIEELREAYVALDDEMKHDIAMIALPMEDRSNNALMVNALQRSSTVIVQNSLREGFGLTVTEAMWKRIPVLSNTRAVGPQQQITHACDGWLIDDPEDPSQIADALDYLLNDRVERAALARAAQRRAHQQFMIFSQLRDWFDLLEDVV